jgi:methionyl-tRNA formyltransferase
MRVVVSGYMTWGHRRLDAVLAAGHEVPLVVTHPESDNPYETIFNEPVAELAAKHGVPVLVRTRADDAEVVQRDPCRRRRCDGGGELIANLVRAQLDPYPNAYCFHGSTRLAFDSPPGRCFRRPSGTRRS